MDRPNIADDLADAARQLIMDGELEPGARINEVELAARLQVSRTPLREALARLSAEGFVGNIPRRGHFVQGLRAGDIAQLYGVRAVLDPAALELAGLPGARQLGALDALNARIAGAAGAVERIIDLDDAWHLALLAHCPNSVLVDLIRQFMQRTRPLERAYVRVHENVETMMTTHATIVGALRAGSLDEAVACLRQNMQDGIGLVVQWVEASNPSPALMKKEISGK
ncbi:MAG: GntR family transcriptional regulator [Gemmatimonadaceae bacterium]